MGVKTAPPDAQPSLQTGGLRRIREGRGPLLTWPRPAGRGKLASGPKDPSGHDASSWPESAASSSVTGFTVVALSHHFLCSDSGEAGLFVLKDNEKNL